MIGQLTGLLIEQTEADRCLIDVNGVGYVVFVSNRTLSRLPKSPEVARVLIETIVREDAILLYGFADSYERDWFRLLTTVQGVGVRMALSILSTLSPDEISTAIMTADKATLTRAPGVGARLAVRIITELSGKVASLSDQVVSAVVSDVKGQNPIPQAAHILSDALLALEGLGFRRIESQPVVARVIKRLNEEDKGSELDLVIRESLKELAR
ncbi:Holliday junction branch migration protein RuvA [Commensalibacter nepenthis]|uniref:Holliday junction branch migration complex subunit RuvA n=1 Tax=Commensalibacter nepenthis TaxID=3043872 RepID=A0ABT6Q8W2_9PROT|nr:Holliday junction branch migration protein RuvA [Commensalibacter sp. TBRC 10068]MDI2113345.1 Holliday junction branch migration protein RuvA [Commensalibacter sp. TBRC 10068]